MQGADKAHTALQALADGVVAALAAALIQSQARIGRRSIPQVPVDTGVMRASWVALPPEVRGSRVRAVVGYGGASAAYVLAQHERTDWRHTVGTHHFLSGPFTAQAGQEARLIGEDLRRWAEGTRR